MKNSLGAHVSLKRNWANVFLKPVADDVVAQQQPGPWWQQLGAMALEGAPMRWWSRQTAERIPFPAGSGRLIVGNKLANSINWDAAAKEFNRVLQPGGNVQIWVYGPTGELRRALAANGFTVRPATGEGGEVFVIATKR